MAPIYFIRPPISIIHCTFCNNSIYLHLCKTSILKTYIQIYWAAFEVKKKISWFILFSHFSLNFQHSETQIIHVDDSHWYQVYTLGAIIFENHIINHDFLPVFKVGLPTSTSIFSAISASIMKISVPIIKRRSWRFRNTPRNQLSDEYWPRKQQKTERLPKLNKTPIFGDLPFSLNCCNLA